MENSSDNDFGDFNLGFFENESNDDLYNKLILGDLNNEFYENKSDSKLNKSIILQFISPEILELIDYNPRILLEFDNVVQDERKYNILDRFFYYSMEETRLVNYIVKEKLEEDVKLKIVQEFYKTFRNLKNKLLGQIKYSFGLHSFSDYLESGRTVLFNNPFLLGISPFLFDQLEWETVILNEIKHSSHSKSNFYNIQLMIRNNLRETLFRLDKEEFENLHGWGKEKMSESELYHLIIDRVFNAVKRSKNAESIIKEIVKKNTVLNSSRIVLTGSSTTGKLIDKIVEGFGRKKIKLSNDEINDIKWFVRLNFRNSTGKNLDTIEVKNKSFLILHIKLLKNILIANKELTKCAQKDIARIINKTLPELGELKTIENY